ncbi:hypothetical protein KY289_029045 [Solanum tuberosum]|nr:hypothetical protein KY289_029045 [Solanum tuberosum]
MATEPPGMQLRPPDQYYSTRNSNINKPQEGASPESSDNSSKLRRTEAIHVAISEQELDWARKIMSLDQSGMIRVNSTGNNESTSNDLSIVQKSNDSSSLIERSMKASFEEIAEKSSDGRPGFRPPSDVMNEVLNIGESSPCQELHPTGISTLFDDEISGGIKSGNVTGAPITNGDEELHQKLHCDEKDLTKVTDPLIQQQSNVCSSSNMQDQETTMADGSNKGEEVESTRMTSRLNQEHNQDLQCEPRKHTTKESTDANEQRKIHGKTDATANHTQIAQDTNSEEQTGVPNKKQQGIREKVIWKVKENPNEKMAGKSIHNLQTPHDHNIAHIAPVHDAKAVNQNEHEKGISVMQDDGTGQNENQKHMRNKPVNHEFPPPPPYQGLFQL